MVSREQRDKIVSMNTAKLRERIEQVDAQLESVTMDHDLSSGPDRQMYRVSMKRLRDLSRTMHTEMDRRQGILSSLTGKS